MLFLTFLCFELRAIKDRQTNGRTRW